MTDTKQPEALRLSEWLDHHGERTTHSDAAAELRRQHAEIEALRAKLDQATVALKDISNDNWPDAELNAGEFANLVLHELAAGAVEQAQESDQHRVSDCDPLLLASFDAYARTLVKKPHKMTPEMWPVGFPFFKAGFERAVAAGARPVEPVQKLRPDFIAGYDAGMADAKRIQAHQPAPAAAVGPSDCLAGSGGWQSHAEMMERDRDYWLENARVPRVDPRSKT